MSEIRFQTKGEARWYVAFLRERAGQRDSVPNGNHVTYGHISPQRQAKLRQDAEQLVRDLGRKLDSPLGDQTLPPRPKIRSKRR